MKNKFVFLLSILLSCCGLLTAQERERIAVFDPSSSGTAIDEGTKMAIRELIGAAIVNMGTYNLVERSLLESVMREQQFSNSGAVDDMQATEIGKLAGANKVVLSVVTLTGGRNMLSIKMIDVMTAAVERQKVRVVSSGELLDLVEPMTCEMLGQEAEERLSAQSSPSVEDDRQIPPPAPGTLSSVDPPIDLSTLREDEVLIYMPPFSDFKKEEHGNLTLQVKWDKNTVGIGKLREGFTIRLSGVAPGKHVLKIGMQRQKVDTSSKRYFQVVAYRWSYFGAAMYSVAIL